MMTFTVMALHTDYSAKSVSRKYALEFGETVSNCSVNSNYYSTSFKRSTSVPLLMLLYAISGMIEQIVITKA